MKASKIIKNEKGALTLSFMFATALILGVTVLISAMTIALTLTEVLQYVSYAGARAYFAGHSDEGIQEDMAAEKVDDLLGSLPFLTGAQSSQWIRVVGRRADDFESYAEQGGSGTFRNRYVGYQIEFEIPLLNLKLPLLGAAIEPPGGTFKTRVNSFLLREPTEAECQQFISNIPRVVSGGNYFSISGNIPPRNVDNGC